MNTEQRITRQLVPVQKRLKLTADLFGVGFPMKLEPFVYHITVNMAEAYNGGYWEFYTLSNNGFYMAPNTEEVFSVSCENGFEGELSSDALGITACLYAYSHLSFGNGNPLCLFFQLCAKQLADLVTESQIDPHPSVPAYLWQTHV